MDVTWCIDNLEELKTNEKQTNSSFERKIRPFKELIKKLDENMNTGKYDFSFILIKRIESQCDYNRYNKFGRIN